MPSGCNKRCGNQEFWWEDKFVHLLWRTLWQYLAKPKLGILNYCPEVTFLDIYHREILACVKKMQTRMFIYCHIKDKCPTIREWINIKNSNISQEWKAL